ncbi:MAG: type II secretion system GspH family protein [Planctomycetaceae bacterium]|jgi:prepilin-type N-terminal cleavage/methylation domain-containing protein|nr:type II secretion system GspH family protein [Planctomycetaceae bacterium]
MNPNENIIENLLPKPSKLGMTLIELLIVLGILAVLSGMTLTLVSEMDSSNRQNTTKVKLDQIESAIIGTPSHYSRFVNDLGRLPVIIDGDGKEFSELWDSNLFQSPENITIEYKGHNNDFENLTNSINNTINVTLNVGWKGPYLNVPNGKLFDGFGNSFWIADGGNEITYDNEDFWNALNPLPNTDPITIIKFGSLGEDNKNDTETETETPATNTTQNWQNKDDKREINSANFFATLHVQILLRDSSTNQTTWLPATKTTENTGYKKYTADSNLSQNDIVLPAESAISTTTNPFEKNDLFICLTQPSTTIINTNWTRTQIFKIGENENENAKYFRWLPYSYKLNCMRVVIFSPYVSKMANATNTEDNTSQQIKTSHIRITTAYYDFSATDNSWKFDDAIKNVEDDAKFNESFPEQEYSDPEHQQTEINTVTFTNLTPGIRKIFAYGYVKNNTTSPSYSNAQHSNLQTIELKTGENFITIYLNGSF